MNNNVDAFLDKAIRALSPSGAQTLLLYVGTRVGIKGEELAGSYPESPNGRPLKLFYTLDGKPSKFKSKKQRGYVMAAIRSGAIKLPYRRTGQLGASITSKAQVDGNSVLVRIGTNKPYGRYVIGGPDVQSHYHAETGWQSLAAQLTAGLPALHDTAVQALADGLRDQLGGTP